MKRIVITKENYNSVASRLVKFFSHEEIVGWHQWNCGMKKRIGRFIKFNEYNSPKIDTTNYSDPDRESPLRELWDNCPPKLAPSDVMRLIKTNTGAILMKEFSALSKAQNLWTRSYFVSTAENVCSDTIQEYIETQKTRG